VIQKNTRKVPKELENLVELPHTMLDVWNWFAELNSTRPVGMAVGAITYTEIKNYFDLLGIEVTPQEVQIIKMLDRVSLKHSEEQDKAEKQKSQKAKK